ncbi:MAG: hypothetical protein RLZZ450_1220 [Pseudomonadota bacterium]|jgi:V8-like Glu-specific endopeptidase
MMSVALFGISSCASPSDEPVPSDFTESGDEISVLAQPVVIGTDDRTLVSAASSTAYPWSAMAALRPTASVTWAHCSAFKVGPRHLLTAAHCIDYWFQGVKTTQTDVNSTRVVYGQFGSGNASANMPVKAKFGVAAIIIPSQWNSTQGNYAHDWALIRLNDSDSTAGWFDALARTDAQIGATTNRHAVGFPLEHTASSSGGNEYSGTLATCAASPLANKHCGGYQYDAPVSSLNVGTTFLSVATDWDRGQSGGAVYATETNNSRKVLLGIISNSGTINGQPTNIAVRISFDIQSVMCTDIKNFPSTAYPAHACNSL